MTDKPEAPKLDHPKPPPTNPNGNPGYHPSTKDFEHAGSQHTSKHR